MKIKHIVIKWLPIVLALLMFGGSLTPKVKLPKDDEKSKVVKYLSTFEEKAPETVPNVYQFAELPVLYNGRVKPYDTIARNTLRLLADTETIKRVDENGKTVKVPPVLWLLDAVSQNDRALDYKIFRIHNLELLEKMEITFTINDHYRFSLRQINEEVADLGPVYGGEKMSRREFLKLEADNAYRTPKEQRSIYHEACLMAYNRLITYDMLVMSHSGTNVTGPERILHYNRISEFIGDNMIRMIPTIHAEWENMFSAELMRFTDVSADKSWTSMHDMLAAWRVNDFTGFNHNLAVFKENSQTIISKARTYLDEKAEKIVSQKEAKLAALGDKTSPGYNDKMESILTWQYNNEVYLGKQRDLWGKAIEKCGFERFYNNWDPFYSSLVFYIQISIFACLGLLIWKRGFWKFAMTAMVFAFVIHTFAIWARWYISGYPPVTNLYSSAVFISWGIALGALILEFIFKRNFALITGAIAAACCLIIAQNLLGGEDSMGMMKAVLDTKFWLATHVITITLGYTATFLAGGIAVVWILGRLIGKIGEKGDLDFSRAIYGLLCYALLLSFVGTVLGGLWADDSWGRFWGWDPKENGALMIVIWCAIVLHARLGGMISFRGLAATAVIGNIITCFSWFGVNLLGVGLHSYGFTDSGFKWVVIFSLVNLIFATLCMIPLPCWKRVSRKPLTEIIESRF